MEYACNLNEVKSFGSCDGTELRISDMQKATCPEKQAEPSTTDAAVVTGLDSGPGPHQPPVDADSNSKCEPPGTGSETECVEKPIQAEHEHGPRQQEVNSLVRTDGRNDAFARGRTIPCDVSEYKETRRGSDLSEYGRRSDLGDFGEADVRPRLRTRHICLHIFLISLVINLVLVIPSCYLYGRYLAKLHQQTMVRADVPGPDTTNFPGNTQALTSSEPKIRHDRKKIEPVIPNAAPGSESKIIGRFQINMARLAENNILRWQPTDEVGRTSNNPSQVASRKILASDNDSCFTVPVTGLYCLFSQITFKYTMNNINNTGSQTVGIKPNGTGNEEFVQKAPFTVQQQDQRNDTVFVPSNLIVCPVSLNRGDKICVHATPVKAILLTQVDNILTIFKL